mmetsp:Transcript_54133/g.89845  ORF Transcript_54133/g.89845 Transcript_54133/m.89845 type:complete len:407 (+) Transcript_54133:95-1315(+)|eukprot:CAMPEP_0119312714 /NCGR_PEP_ID=MMETSP1333-20130426/26969_1 /TAXON_ID=418940 /ORGANISM="Scyphosphaera apsteinii, Strain RCC1455" /LENGTH=406 /DNA_ID=CAMNT_0007317371 /DNA_START=95 /DNA_END=1315 /DNA_ORIENTATION=-
MTELPHAAAPSTVTNIDPAAQAASLVAASQVVALPDASTTMMVVEGQGHQQQDTVPHAQRWSISRDVKQVLEEVYRLEKFPSTEMRRRLATNFGVSPRQVQFWFQNRRQRDRKIIRDQGGGGATAVTVSGAGGVDSMPPYVGLPEHARQAMAAGQPVMIMPNGSCVVVPSSAGSVAGFTPFAPAAGHVQYSAAMPMMNASAGFFPYYVSPQQYQAAVHPLPAVSGEDVAAAGAPAGASVATAAGATGVDAPDAAKAPEAACCHVPAVGTSAASPALQQMLYGYPTAGGYAPGLPIAAATPLMVSSDSRSMMHVVDPTTGQVMMMPMPMAPGAPVTPMVGEPGPREEPNPASNGSAEPAAMKEESGPVAGASAEDGVEIDGNDKLPPGEANRDSGEADVIAEALVTA